MIGVKTIPAAMAKARELAVQLRAAAPGIQSLVAKKSDSGTEGELFIYAAIGSSWWSDGVTAQQVVDKLAELKGVKKLSVRINSEGGEIWEGKTIENAIRRFDCAEKVTYVDGLAASAATFIAMACPKVVSAANATWMIHEVATVASGRAADLRAVADLVDKENQTVAETYARKTKKTTKECLALMAAETWMTASEAKEHGFSDETARPDNVACECPCEDCQDGRCPDCSCGGCEACGEGGGCNGGECEQGAGPKDAARAKTPAELVATARAEFAHLRAKFGGASPARKPGEPGATNNTKPGIRQEKSR